MKRPPAVESAQSAEAPAKSHADFLLLLCILLAALALRLPGTQWELPGALHSYGYHPDELPLLSAASNVNFLAGRFDPGFYNYGTLWIYLLRIPLSLASEPGGFNLGLATMLARLMAAGFGVSTALICWHAGKALAGRNGAALAATCVALAPLHVQQSQFATVDVPATFFVALCLYLSVAGRLPWAGVAAGLAGATKYTCALVIISPLLACFLSSETKNRALSAGLVVVTAALGFIVACPGAVLWPHEFLSGFFQEAQHASTGHGLVFLNTGPGWLYHLLHSLLPGLGWPLLALSIGAIGICLVKGPRSLWPTLAFTGAFYALLSSAEVRFARYVIPLIPAFGMLIAAQSACWRPALWAGTAALTVTLVYAILLDRPFLTLDPRTAAAAWISQNVRPGSSIGMPGVPWFYSPPLSPEFGQLSAQARREAASADGKYKLEIPDNEWGVSVLEKRPDYVILSSYEWMDRRRLRDPDYETFMARLDRAYTLQKSFGGDPPVRFFTLAESLPHDMEYVTPQIDIYGRTPARR
ncbi:MAG: glycosyltransferase family 39 protein [Armatimonadetes bacterium]|nr:glycosyltransferase family 39 protein [Armatimonadota bacterium]